jgi:hypothetical protein
MPYFRIVLEGAGIAITEGIDGVKSPVVRGFFVARFVRAASREDAIARAKTMVADDWTRGLYAHLKENPNVAVSDAQRVGLWKWLLPRHTGYIFHPGK